MKWPKSEEKLEFGVDSFLVAVPLPPPPQLDNRSYATAFVIRSFALYDHCLRTFAYELLACEHSAYEHLSCNRSQPWQLYIQLNAS